MANLEELPEDYYVKQSAFTKTLYRDIYPAIDPENERLSQKGKIVVITGASQGIGQKVLHRIVSQVTGQMSPSVSFYSSLTYPGPTII